METITFIELNNDKKGRGRKINDNEIRIYRRKGHNSITLNTTLTRNLINEDKTNMRIAKNNLTGQIYLVFSKEGLKPSQKDSNLRYYGYDLLKIFMQYLNINGNDFSKSIKISDNESRDNRMNVYSVMGVINM